MGDDDSTGSVGTAPQKSPQKPESKQHASPTQKPRSNHGAGARRHAGGLSRGIDRAPLLRKFEVTSDQPSDSGRGVLVEYQINDRDKRVRVTLRVMSASGPQVLLLKDLGNRVTGIKQQYLLQGLELDPGQYRVVLSASDRAGHKLKSSSVARVASFKVSDRYFPVQGQWSWSGPGGEFGAARPGRSHQGYDIIAPEGSHVIAPTAGTVTWVDFQAGGAGYYVVLTATDNTAYVFMHLREGGLRVKKGDQVPAGLWIADVGATGDAVGAHLHFEVWPGGWPTGQPIDPEPLLQQWAGR